MRHSAVVALVIALVVPLHAQQQTRLLVPLTTDDGKRAGNISVDNLTIAENGQPLTISKVEPFESPIRVTLAIENSRAFADNFAMVRLGAKAFVKALPEGVEVSLTTTAPQPRMALKSTRDQAAMLKAIDNVSPDTGPGRFADACLEWIARVDKDKEKGTYRPVLVIVGSTYGDEIVNSKQLNDTMNRLPAVGATIHVLLMSAKANIGSAAETQIGLGQEATRMTGGKYEEVFNVQRVQAALPELGAAVAKLQTGSAYVVTVQRPSGAPAQLGPLSLTAPEGVTIGRISLAAPTK
jgi:hypothetical protein